MYRTKRANGHEVFHRDVSRESCAIHEKCAVADHAIMPDVRIGQEKIAIAQQSFAAAFFRAAADGHILAKNIAVTRHQLGALTAKGVVLRVASDRAKGIKHIVPAEFRRSPHGRVRVHRAAVT